jgi:hypothetical protein
MTSKSLHRHLISITSALVLATGAIACGGGEEETTASDDSGTDSGTSGAEDTTGETGDGDGDGDGDGCTTDTLPDGSSCECADQCASGKCYVVPLIGGQCGACESDADCPDGGCSVPNPLAGTGSSCNMGELGEGCETDAVCQAGLTCEELLDVAGLIQLSTCSECTMDSDCGTDLCSPTYDVANFKGEWACVAPGTVENGGGCDLDTTGDDACIGDCAEANVMGLVTLGVCSDCDEDADCAAGEVCLEPEIDLTTGDVTPSACGTAP